MTDAKRPSSTEPLSRFDLRLRSLDRHPGEPINLCSTCSEPASWSVWLHTPDWSARGGLTLVLCTMHALLEIEAGARHALSKGSECDCGAPFGALSTNPHRMSCPSYSKGSRP